MLRLIRELEKINEWYLERRQLYATPMQTTFDQLNSIKAPEQSVSQCPNLQFAIGPECAASSPAKNAELACSNITISMEPDTTHGHCPACTVSAQRCIPHPVSEAIHKVREVLRTHVPAAAQWNHPLLHSPLLSPRCSDYTSLVRQIFPKTTVISQEEK